MTTTTRLRVENRPVSPTVLGLGDPSPRLSWQVTDAPDPGRTRNRAVPGGIGEEAGRRPLQQVEQEGEEGEVLPAGAKDVRRPDVARADRPQVLAVRPGDDLSDRTRPDKIGDHDGWQNDA